MSPEYQAYRRMKRNVPVLGLTFRKNLRTSSL